MKYGIGAIWFLVGCFGLGTACGRLLGAEPPISGPVSLLLIVVSAATVFAILEDS